MQVDSNRFHSIESYRERSIRRSEISSEGRYRARVCHEGSQKERDCSQGPGGSRQGGEGHVGGGRPAVGGQDVLLLPGRGDALPRHGVPARRGPDEPPDEIRHLAGGVRTVLRGRDLPCPGVHTPARIHSQVGLFSEVIIEN